MAEPISLASGLVALSVFAFQSSKNLCQLVESFQNHGRNVEQLKNELAALTGVLDSLQETVNQNTVDLCPLERPLLHCGKACEEFEAVINKCSSHTKQPRTSFRDWFKISWKGKDISAFTSMIAGYKATITIALGDANIRTSKVTAKLLCEYKAMIFSTTCDLQDILYSIDTSMRDPIFRDSANIQELSATQTNLEEERASIQQCLRICVDVSSHIDQVQVKDLTGITLASSDGRRGTAIDKTNLAHFITSETLADCKRGIGFTAVELQARLKDANRRLTNAKAHESTHQDLGDLFESVKQCLSICDQAADQMTKQRVNVFEDVSTADDGHQLILSTVGDLISARRVTVGSRSIQWLGQMSDASLQQLSKDQARGTVERDGQTAVKPGTHFENRHGNGQKLRGD